MKINSIIVVGGGSSGWMTAAALGKCCPNIKTTLIASSSVPIIGVGESTLTNINQYLRMLGLKDTDWMPECGASYKTSIRFSNFQGDETYYQDTLKSVVPPVKMNSIVDFFMLCHLFPEEFKVRDFSKFFDDNDHMTETACFSAGHPRMFWNWSEDHAYHMDADRFGLALKTLVADPSGVEYIEDLIEEVLTDDSGIAGLRTTLNGTLKADLYIDCSGFRSLLLGETLGVPFNSFLDRLPNDRAWATTIDYQDPDREMTSYTDCRAMNAGWCWSIPTYERMGSGYVYSSQFLSDEQALAEYKAYLDSTFGARYREPRLIQFQAGVREQAWYKNCLGIGVSNGFIEPLRSTGLMMTHINVIRLVDLLERTQGDVNRVDRDAYNFLVKDHIHGLVNLVTSNYCFSRRRDTAYWRHVTENIPHNTPYYQSFALTVLDNIPNPNSLYDFNLRILTGNNYNPISRRSFLERISAEETRRLTVMRDYWRKRKSELEQLTNTFPSQYEFLSKEIYRDAK